MGLNPRICPYCDAPLTPFGTCINLACRGSMTSVPLESDRDPNEPIFQHTTDRFDINLAPCIACRYEFIDLEQCCPKCGTNRMDPETNPFSKRTTRMHAVREHSIPPETQRDLLTYIQEMEALEQRHRSTEPPPPWSDVRRNRRSFVPNTDDIDALWESIPKVSTHS